MTKKQILLGCLALIIGSPVYAISVTDGGIYVTATMREAQVRDCLVTQLRAAPENFGTMWKSAGPLFQSYSLIIVTVHPGGPLLSGPVMYVSVRSSRRGTVTTYTYTSVLSAATAREAFTKAAVACGLPPPLSRGEQLKLGRVPA